MSSTTTWISTERLAEHGELGGIMVRLMMALQDFALADHSMGTWKAEEDHKLQDRKVGAVRYFLRLQLSHVFEAFEIIKEIEEQCELRAAVDACDRQTVKAYQTVIEFMKGDDYNLLLRIRNNIGFHYGRKVALQSLKRLEKRPNKNGALTIGNEALTWYFEPTEWVENDVIVHGIFGLPEDEEPTDLSAKTDDIVMRLHNIAHAFGDFAGYFIKGHAKI